VIENAPFAGIMLGWGRYLRDVAATGNVVRKADIGIAVSVDRRATALIGRQCISDSKRGAIVAWRHQAGHRRPQPRRLGALRPPDRQRKPRALNGEERLERYGAPEQVCGSVVLIRSRTPHYRNDRVKQEGRSEISRRRLLGLAPVRARTCRGSGGRRPIRHGPVG